MNAFGVEHGPISKGSKSLKLVSRQAKLARKSMAANGEQVRRGGKWVDNSPAAIRRHVANGGQRGTQMGQGWKGRMKRTVDEAD